MSILVSDYDGTLYTDEKNMRINCAMLRDFISQGNYFVLSSGRAYDSLMDQVKKYNIPYTHLSCADGSFLYNYDRLIFTYPISHDSVDLFNELAQIGKDTRLEYAYPDRYGKEYVERSIIGSVALTIDKQNIEEKFIKEFERIRRKHPEYQYDVYGYENEVFYLIRPHGISKTVPIKFLQNDLGITREDVYTIGDNTNDKELIRDYNGYRIGNNKDIIDVALREYDSVHQLIKDINNGKAIKRW